MKQFFVNLLTYFGKRDIIIENIGRKEEYADAVLTIQKLRLKTLDTIVRKTNKMDRRLYEIIL